MKTLCPTIAVLTLGVLMFASPASAAPDPVWRGGASDQPHRWHNPANWQSSDGSRAGVPKAGSDVSFRKPPLKQEKVIIAEPAQVGRIKFVWGGESPGPVEIVGQAKGRLAISQGIIHASGEKQTLNVPVTLRGDQAWQIKSYPSDLLVKGPLDTGEYRLTLSGDGKINVRAPVKGHAALTIKTVYPVFFHEPYQVKGETRIRSGMLSLRSTTANCGPVTIGGAGKPAMLSGYPGEPATYTVRYNSKKVANPITVEKEGILAIRDLKLDFAGQGEPSKSAYIVADYEKGSLRGEKFAAVTGEPDGCELVYGYQGDNKIALVRKDAADKGEDRTNTGGAESIEVSPLARRVLKQYLSREEIQKALKAISVVNHGSLGPDPDSIDVRQRMANHAERSITIDPQAHAEKGDGSAAKPWVNAIGNFFRTEPIARPGIVRVPAGHYREGTLEIPEKVWLVGEAGETMIEPWPKAFKGEDGDTAMFKPASHAGLVNLDIDGGRTANDQPRIDAVKIDRDADHVRVLSNRIHDVPEGEAITGNGRNAVILANHLKTIGTSGIDTGSEWLVAHNIIEYAGIDREGGGGGDDGVIPGHLSSGSVIRNNLAISAKRPNARHAMATQSSNLNDFLGNVLVAKGHIRGGMVLADGSFANRALGNVLIGTDDAKERTRMGIHFNGALNVARGNAVIGTAWGGSIYSRSGNRFVNNYFKTDRAFVNTRNKKPNVVEANKHEKLPDD